MRLFQVKFLKIIILSFNNKTIFLHNNMSASTGNGHSSNCHKYYFVIANNEITSIGIIKKIKINKSKINTLCNMTCSYYYFYI